MKITKLKNAGIFLVVTATSLSFPLQLIYRTPLMSLLPYIVLGIIFILTHFSKMQTPKVIWNIRRPIILAITIYLVLFFINTSWQVVFGFITPMAATSAMVVFLLPVLFFIYFRFFATTQHFRLLFFAIIVCGLLNGLYFAYDSYSMLVSLQVSDYAHKAIEYIELRAPGGDDTNLARVTVGSRSHGLLEKHSVSSAWVVLGCLASLTTLPSSEHLKRSLVIMFFGLMVVIGMNFTSIAGFVFVVCLIEYKGYYIFRVRTYINIGARLITIVLAVGVVLLLAGRYLNLTDLYKSIERLLIFQVGLADGTIEFENGSFIGNLLYQLIFYPFLIIDYPVGLLIGDGFSTFGNGKGGDFGIVETLHIFGLPFFLIIFIGLIRLIFSSIKKINSNEIELMEKKYLWFAVSFVTYIIFSEVHYSIWAAKAVLPILFIALAIFDRYLYSPKFHYTCVERKSKTL